MLAAGIQGRYEYTPKSSSKLIWQQRRRALCIDTGYVGSHIQMKAYGVRVRVCIFTSRTVRYHTVRFQFSVSNRYCTVPIPWISSLFWLFCEEF